MTDKTKCVGCGTVFDRPSEAEEHIDASPAAHFLADAESTDSGNTSDQ